MNKLALRICLLPLCVSALTACVSHTDQQLEARSTTTAAYIEGVPGSTITRHTVMLVTVKAIDHAQHKLTLVDADQDERTVSIDPKIANLTDLAQGDKIKITLIEEQLIFVKQTHDHDKTATLAIVEKDAHATGAFIDQTRQQVAEVRAVDLTNHTATLLFNNGSVRTIKVRPDVALSESSLGKTVVFQISEAMAVAISKP